MFLSEIQFELVILLQFMLLLLSALNLKTMMDLSYIYNSILFELTIVYLIRKKTKNSTASSEQLHEHTNDDELSRDATDDEMFRPATK